MDNAFEVGKKLLELVNTGKSRQALDSLYSPNAKSIEAAPGPNQVCDGIDAIRAKHDWWESNSEVHSASAKGPFPLGDRFAVIYAMDVTMKDSGKRGQMEEVGLYTIENGKIVKEEYMYQTEF
ncbi:MAG: SnoaL-like domain-containing protein [Oligoflexales bacterium]